MTDSRAARPRKPVDPDLAQVQKLVSLKGRPKTVPMDDVREFANASPRVQARVLSVLRYNAAITVHSELVALALVTAFVVGVYVYGFQVPDSDPNWIGLLVLILIGMAILGAGTYSLVTREARAASAADRLGAFEAELTRRHAARGWRARQWQKRHGIDW